MRKGPYAATRRCQPPRAGAAVAHPYYSFLHLGGGWNLDAFLVQHGIETSIS